MEDFEDYSVLIEDIMEDKPKLITKARLIKIFNNKISLNRNLANTPKGIEIDVHPAWEEILQTDGSILWEYEKIGWRVMWYKESYATKPPRSWLSFRNAKYKKE